MKAVTLDENQVLSTWEIARLKCRNIEKNMGKQDL